MNILVILVHPKFKQSQLNKRLLAAVNDIEQITVHDLYAAYPDGVIDVDAEQRRLIEADLIVFQHPFYWYSAPALLKEWFDLVLQYNFAYGPEGEALKGKKWLSVLSTGSTEDAYSQQGIHNYSIRDLLRPFEQTAALCHMEFMPPLIAFGSRHLAAHPEQLNDITGLYNKVLTECGTDSFDFSATANLATLNQLLEA